MAEVQEKNILAAIAEAITSGEDIALAIQEHGGNDVLTRVVNQGKRMVVKENRNEAATKYLEDKLPGVDALRMSVDDDMTALFPDVPQGDSVRLDFAAHISDDGTVETWVKTKYSKIKTPVIMNSNGEKDSKENFNSFGRRTYNKVKAEK